MKLKRTKSDSKAHEYLRKLESLDTLWESRNDTELMVRIINDSDASSKFRWTVGMFGRQRQLADCMGKNVVYLCPPLACVNSGEVIEKLNEALEWAYHATTHDIWATALSSEAAIKMNSDGQQGRQFLDETMRSIMIADALIVTNCPDTAIRESVAFQYARLRKIPIFDVSGDPVRSWNFDGSCFEYFCSKDNMFRLIKSEAEVFRSECMENPE